jgi:PQQ-dependent dehydrogenase (methanol/ethanol family)
MLIRPLTRRSAKAHALLREDAVGAIGARLPFDRGGQAAPPAPPSAARSRFGKAYRATTAVSFLIAVSPCSAQQTNSSAELFVERCAVCHGADATGTDRGPALAANRRLRTRLPSDIANIIRNGTPGGMPGFALPETEVSAIAEYVRSLNANAFDTKPPGDAAAGERFFFGPGNCVSCHTVGGRGGHTGPDLSNIARQSTLRELERSLTDPSARIAPGYAVVDVTLNSGRTLRGFARSRGSHDLQLQTLDGALHLLADTEYRQIRTEEASLMLPLRSTPDEYRDLLAWLSRLGGRTGPLTGPVAAPPAAEFEAILHPQAGDWPTYYGNLSGNRYSTLDQINAANASRLEPRWIYPIQYQPLETTPLVSGGVMYVTGPNQVFALDGRSGREIWRYVRPRTPAGTIAGDAALGANRGVALLGDRVFFATDNAHMICLNRLTGALLWDVFMPETPQHYGATAAPLVVGDLVISGVAGGDEGIRGFIGAWNAATGELAWRFWTVPNPGEPGANTWNGNAVEGRGGATWLTGTYDPSTGLLYWPTGNPFPDTDGTERGGDNLYTNCDLALDPKTGQLRWYFQFTPHDLHDWDAVQPPVLVDAEYQGTRRKLLLHANRNGYLYVLDRTNGKFLFGKPFVRKLTWSSGLDAAGRPILTPNNETKPGDVKTCPAVRGATNWYSPAFSPLTNLYYVMVVEDCGVYHQAKQGGFGFLDNPRDPGMKYLRALNIETGAIAWEIPQAGPPERNYSGVLATAGGVVFYGESSGGFAAVDARTGATLWHFEAGTTWKASPITYTVAGRQYVAIAAGANILSFALPEN